MTTAVVFGSFDLLHPGHIRFLRQVKTAGNYVIVILNSDQYIRRRKGHRPTFTYRERAALVGAIRYVDRIVRGPDATTLTAINMIIRRLRPDRIYLTSLQRATPAELDDLHRRGARPCVITLPTTVRARYSSTTIKRHIRAAKRI